MKPPGRDEFLRNYLLLLSFFGSSLLVTPASFAPNMEPRTVRRSMPSESVRPFVTCVSVLVISPVSLAVLPSPYMVMFPIFSIGFAMAAAVYGPCPKYF